MSQDFDPYFRWLKIPPSDQPPNHYRLLNTARFESDPEIIETAVARLVTLLQNVSTGDQTEHAQRILNDVAKARLCLSDPKQKAAYDEQLRKTLSGSTKKAPVKPPRRKGTPQDTTQPRSSKGKRKAPAGKARSGSKTVGKKRRPATKKKLSAKSKQQEASSSLGLIIGYAVATLVVAGAALFFLFQNLSQRGNNANDVAVETSNEDWQEESSLNAGAFDDPGQPETAETAVTNRVEDSARATNNKNDFATGQQSGQAQTPIPAAVSSTPSPTASPVTAPATQPPSESEATGELLPHQLARFEAKLDEVVEFQGVPVSAGDSSTGKTRYLRFSRDWDKSIMVFMLTREVGDDLTVAELQKYVGKTVRINGVVERQFGTNRLGVKIQAKDQLEIVE